jgi:hypothetical protein
MKKQEIRDLYVQCDCGSEHVFVTPQDFDKLEDGIYMAILANEYNGTSFWYRFRHIWYTLIHGVPYTDQVCLDYDKVKQLEKYLSNYITMTEFMKKQNKKGAK